MEKKNTLVQRILFLSHIEIFQYLVATKHIGRSD